MVSPESEQVFLGKDMCEHTSEYIGQLVEAVVCNNPKLETSQMSSYRRRGIYTNECYTAKRTNGPQKCTTIGMNLKHNVGKRECM